MDWPMSVLLEGMARRGSSRSGTLEPMIAGVVAKSCDVPVHRVRLLPEQGPLDERTLYVCGTVPGVTVPVLIAAEDAVAASAAVQDVLDDLNDWDARLLEAMAQRRSIAEVLAIGAEALANPIALFDTSTALVGYAGELPEGYEDTIWGAVVTRGYAPLSYYAADEREQMGREILATREPYVSYPRREHGRAHITAMAYADGRPYAMLSQVDLVAPFSPGQRALLAHVRDRIEQMADALVGSRRHASPIEHCVRMLLEGTRVEESVVRFHLAARGWHMGDAFGLLRCSSQRELSEVELENLHARFSAAAPEALVLAYQEHIVLIPRGGMALGDGNPLMRVAREYELGLGLSSAFVGFMRVRAAYEQASVALDLAGRPGTIACYDELFPARVAALLKDGASPEELCHPQLLALAASDDVHVQEYLRTLLVYLLCGCNVAKAAKRLYLHRNTLEYRLRRLGERAGIDWEHVGEAEQLRLMLSCLLLVEQAPSS